MHTGAEVEQFRQKYGFTVSCIRESLDMTEVEYRKFINGQYKPAAYQLIWFLTAYRCPLDSIIGKQLKEEPPPFPYKKI